MIRKLLLILLCTCGAIVLAQTAALGLLWRRGVLTSRNLGEIQILLAGAQDPQHREVADKGPVIPQVAYADVQDARVKKVLDISRTEDGLETLQQSVVDARNRVEEQQSRFRAEQQAFLKKLDELEKTVTDAAVEQARGVLLALPPAQAADRLTIIPLNDALTLMKAMPEKNIAKILKEFAGTENKLERGQKLFDGLYKGQPQRALLDQTRAQLSSPGPLPAAP